MNSEITKRIRICYDMDYQWDYDDEISIAYLSRSRHCLGTKAVSRDELDEIRDGIADGSLIGCKVYAYVHGDATIAITPFSDPWDSGESGFVYVTRKTATGWSGRKNKGTAKKITKKDKELALKACEGMVKAFDKYLRGETYGFVAEELVEKIWQRSDGTSGTEEDWVHVDSCWGFLGSDPKENGMEEHVSHLLAKGYVWTDEDGKEW